MRSLCLSVILFLSFLYSFSAFSAVAEISIVKGKSATYAGKAIKVGDKIETGKELKTGARTFVKVLLGESKSYISVGPRSKVLIEEIKEEESIKAKVTLIAGAFRFKGKSAGKKEPAVYTRNASMGIRGTDFLLKANEILGESEIVLFSGLVQMTNLADAENSETIAPGQWGGIGGRFGPKVQKPIQLPSKALTGFEKLLNW